MDCISKFAYRGFILLCSLTALFWGYERAGWRVAQNSDADSVRDSQTQESDDQGMASQKGGKKIQLNVSVPAQSGLAAESSAPSTSLANSSENADDTTSVQSKAAELDRKTDQQKIEPDLSDGTYNQVRVKKPSIPDRFENPVDANRQNEELRSGSPMTVLGVLGIPTLVFSVLFFVMWGIISGKIQRIMF